MSDEKVAGVSEEMFNLASTIIISGFKAKQTPDTIKSAIFSKGVPFSKLNKLYNFIVKEEKLIADPKEVEEKIAKVVNNKYFNSDDGTVPGSVMDYDHVNQCIEDCVEKVDGASPQKVRAVVRSIFKENDLPLPKKPVVSGRLGVVAKTMIDVFGTIAKSTEKECVQALEDAGMTPKGALKYARQFHKVCYAIANKIPSDKILEVLSKDV